jgi:AraC family transcriptional regulator, exoenzyme S synthesis regulatory protein ExsA
MINMQEFIASSPFAKKIEVDDLLFAEFKCPMDDEKSSIWWHNNFFAHVLSGQTVLKTPKHEYVLKAGDCAFAKKGSVLTHNNVHEDFCELLVFVPDDFIRSVSQKYKVGVIQQAPSGASDTVILLKTNQVLESYFQSLLTHFVQTAPPHPPLMKLKFEELLLNILSGSDHQPLKSYLFDICRTTKASIREVMELNFFSNLSLEEFARLCGRSLTVFKKEFFEIYKTTPGRWLQGKRLEYSRYLLDTTDLSLDEICLESGFENHSHFNRVFKNKFGVSPGKFRFQKNKLPETAQSSH